MKPGRLTELGLQRLDLLCGFLCYKLERRSLIQAPILLMGFRSIADSPALRGHEAALGNLRRICRGLGTQAALRAAAARYNDRAADGSAFSGHFRIDERSLSFEPLFDFPSDRLKLALAELAEPPLSAAHGIALADPAKPMYISVSFDGEVRRYQVTGLPACLPPPAQHHHQRAPSEPIDVLWSDLIAQAEEMDSIDREQFADRPGNWVSRLESTTLTTPTGSGTLEELCSIRLAGLKHLIGLPGAGKTTLLVCLLRHLAMRGIRTAVFFPSIEVCRQYLEDLRRYGVNAGLLVGQGRETRQSHAQRLGESLATGDDLRGFARSSNAAHLFEGICALPALTEAPPQAFSVESRFCREILQRPDGKDRLSSHLCPAWQLCSLNRAARELANAPIWLGHIRSADTRVPAHTIDQDARYFDLIAHQFDVAIFDEADKAQQDLDMSGISQLRLSGYEQSQRLKVFIDQRFPAWRGRVVAVVKDIPQDSAPGGYVTPARVEALGDNPEWDVLIFPMGALGRGTNVVFSAGPRQRDATIGTLYFLTRPHPSPDDLSLLVSIGAQATQTFNRRCLDDFSTLEELSSAFLAARRKVYGEVGRLLRHPLGMEAIQAQVVRISCEVKPSEGCSVSLADSAQ
jgi:hypothetical protein